METNESRIYDLSIPMEASDDQEYLKEISNYFITNSVEMMPLLDVAIHTKDWAKAQHFSHKLSSNFFMFGLNEGGKALSQIEHNLIDNTGYEMLPIFFSIAKKQGDLAIMQLKNDFHL